MTSSKLADLTTVATVTGDEYVYLVDDPGGTPLDRKVTVDSLLARGTITDVMKRVRVATTAAGTLASSFENGDTVDGVTLATGDRILLKNQATGADNGIYVVAASGAPARAADFDASAEALPNTMVVVAEGTTNADTVWQLTTNGPITLGSTALVFAQFGAGSGSSGLTKIAQVVRGSSGTFTFSSIAGTYESLLVVVHGSSSVAAVNDMAMIRFNSDSGSNYDSERTQAAAGTSTPGENLGQSYAEVGRIPGASAAAGSVGTLSILIPGYARTVFQKAYTSEGSSFENTSTGTAFRTASAGRWRNTAAITDIFIGTTLGNFITGSVATLYGVSA